MTTTKTFIEELQENYAISSVESQQKAYQYVKDRLLEASLKGRGSSVFIKTGENEDFDAHHNKVAIKLRRESIHCLEMAREVDASKLPLPGLTFYFEVPFHVSDYEDVYGR